jgi:hypothetical protein
MATALTVAGCAWDIGNLLYLGFCFVDRSRGPVPAAGKLGGCNFLTMIPEILSGNEDFRAGRQRNRLALRGVTGKFAGRGDPMERIVATYLVETPIAVEDAAATLASVPLIGKALLHLAGRRGLGAAAPHPAGGPAATRRPRADASACVVDSQSVKAAEAGGLRAYDAGKKNRRPQAAPAG